MVHNLPLLLFLSFFTFRPSCCHLKSLHTLARKRVSNKGILVLARIWIGLDLCHAISPCHLLAFPCIYIPWRRRTRVEVNAATVEDSEISKILFRFKKAQ